MVLWWESDTILVLRGGSHPQTAASARRDMYRTRYYKLVLHAMKWVALVTLAVCILLLVLILSDLFFHVGWGYPWWSVVAVLAIMTGAFAFRWIAIKILQINT
jgi:hypothetical protein